MFQIVRYLLLTLFSIGMVFLALSTFWIFFVFFGMALLAYWLYLKIFHPGKATIRSYTIQVKRPHSYATDTKTDEPAYATSSYTTVIDAEDPEKEYQIPRIK